MKISRDYWQVRIFEEDWDKTAVTSYNGLFQFPRMPFGLKCAQGMFEQAMHVLLTTVKWQFSIIHIFVYARKTHQSGPTGIDFIIRRRRDHKSEKCEFFTDRIHYLLM